MTKLDEIKAGDRVEVDDGFPCMPAGKKIVKADEAGGLYVLCTEGPHYLDGQVDEPDGDLVGVRLCERHEVTAETDVFVFGSNLAGVHGAGAARFAVQRHGAIMGVGVGLQGLSYGIPTKDRQIQTMPLDDIQPFVEQFLEFAESRPDLTFYITPIGCGLAGYRRDQIRPMFRGMPANCRFAETWDDADTN